ncbi:hypothetical protein QTP88_004555 [Uroleucon formosanum]
MADILKKKPFKYTPPSPPAELTKSTSYTIDFTNHQEFTNVKSPPKTNEEIIIFIKNLSDDKMIGSTPKEDMNFISQLKINATIQLAEHWARFGQGYDGASAMSGYLHGAQEYIKKDFPMALYVHCSANSLNLALANASSLPTIKNCISTIQTVGTFFRSSAQRSEVLRISIIETLPQARHSTLVALCETRWVYKHESVLRFKELYLAIIVALEKLESSINKETAQKSCQLLSSIKDAKFVIPLIIIENIFSYTLTLCKQLQTINADLVETYFPRFANRQTQRNNVPANSSEEYYKLNIFLPFLDHIRIQLSDRFQKHKFLIKSLQQIIPSKCINPTSEEINDCVQFYSRILTKPTVFKAEFSIWKSKWLKEESRPNTAIEGLENCNILLFPNIWKLLQVLATIPMSTTTPERTFSSLKEILETDVYSF